MNKLVDEYNKTCDGFIVNKPIDADYSALTEDTKSCHKTPKFKVGDTVKITKYRNIFSYGYTENRSREIFAIDTVFKTNPWTYKIKDLNDETIKGSFYEK